MKIIVSSKVLKIRNKTRYVFYRHTRRNEARTISKRKKAVVV